MSRWHDLGRHVLPARHVRCEWALVVDNGKIKMSLSRSSRTNDPKSPANAIWRAHIHLINYGHYPTCNTNTTLNSFHYFFKVSTICDEYIRYWNNGMWPGKWKYTRPGQKRPQPPGLGLILQEKWFWAAFWNNNNKKTKQNNTKNKKKQNKTKRPFIYYCVCNYTPSIDVSVSRPSFNRYSVF